MIELEQGKMTREMAAKVDAAVGGYGDYLKSLDISDPNDVVVVTAAMAAVTLLVFAIAAESQPDDIAAEAKGLLHMQFVPNAEMMIDFYSKKYSKR